VKLEILGFSQERLMALGLSLDEALLLRWFIDFKGTDRMEEHVNPEDGQAYYWVKAGKLVSDLPILTPSEEYASKKFKKLSSSEVLKRYVTLTKDGRKTCYRINSEKYSELILSEEEKPIRQNCRMGEEAIRQNCPMPIRQKCPMPLDIITSPEIYKSSDSSVSDNLMSPASDGSEVPTKGVTPPDAHQAAEQFKTKFNAIDGVKPCSRLNVYREIAVSTILGHFTAEEIDTAFRKLGASSFLTGKTVSTDGRQFNANFDWFTKLDNFTRIYEGAYDNEDETVRRQGKSAAADPVTNSAFEGKKGGLEVW
jgi:hypothetical protein